MVVPAVFIEIFQHNQQYDTLLPVTPCAHKLKAVIAYCIERSEEKQPDTTTYEPGVLHQEIPAGTLVEPAPLRRSARNRRQPERYQDYDLMDVEIEDALR